MVITNWMDGLTHHLKLEFTLQNTHLDEVVELAVEEHSLSHPSLLLETSFLETGQRPFVCRERFQLDTMAVELLEKEF